MKERSITRSTGKLWHTHASWMFVWAFMLLGTSGFSQDDSLKGVIKVRRTGTKAAYLVKAEYDYKRFDGQSRNFFSLPDPPVPDTSDHFAGKKDPAASDTLKVLQKKRDRPAPVAPAITHSASNLDPIVFGGSGFSMGKYLEQSCDYIFPAGDTVKLDSVRVEFVVDELGKATLTLLPWNDTMASSPLAEPVLIALKPLWIWYPALDLSDKIPYPKKCAVIYTIYAVDEDYNYTPPANR